MTPRLTSSALALVVAACGGNVAQENSNDSQPGTASSGGAPTGSTTVPSSGDNSGLRGGLVELTPDIWAELNNGACAGSNADINPRQGIPGDASIATQGVSCVYPLASPGGKVPDPSRVNLVYSHGDPPSIWYIIGESDGNCANGDGWYMSADGFQFVLCAKTCVTVQQDPSSMIDVRVGCGGPIIVN
jgi:hypothetical protein